jgi:hypothetical protein
MWNNLLQKDCGLGKPNTCPLSTKVPRSLHIPPVPVTVGQDVPIVPKPSGDIYNPRSDRDLGMGGTTPSYESSNQAPRGSWDSYQAYQVGPPHAQNTHTPCEVYGEHPFAPQRELGIPREPLIADPNRGPRRCYQIYSPGQQMVGRVCTTPGTKGPLYSRMPGGYFGPGVNGNADWVRGNRFGWNYSQKMITDRPNYVYSTVGKKYTNPTMSARNPFFPYPGWCQEKNAWFPDPSAGKPNVPPSNLQGHTFKTYPVSRPYDSCGKPTWVYPYETTQPGTRDPPKLESFADMPQQSRGLPPNLEGFANMSGSPTSGVEMERRMILENFINEQKVCSQYGCSVFWIGVLALLFSLWRCAPRVR